jgi:GntR family transcriptional regulator
MQIDPASPEYPYVQLADYLRSQISNGTITDVLPSILTLSQQTGLAVNTVRRALRILIDEGLIETRQGRGTFVRRG